MLGLIDIGIHPELPYLSGYPIHLTMLNAEGQFYSAPLAYKGGLHGSQVASILCGSYYEATLPQITAIEAISIPRRGKTILCLLRALDAMLNADIRVLCLPVGINLSTPVFLPFIKALTARGVLVVVPSGNKGKGTVLAPGSYPEVLTVGALDMDGNIARYSGRRLDGPKASRKPEIFVRGEFPDPAKPDSGKTIRGTSMACAFVAGKAARIWQLLPNASLSEIRAKLNAGPPTVAPELHFSEKCYTDSRLKAALRSLETRDRQEGIIISGKREATGTEPLPMAQLLKDVEARSGCAPLAVNYFSVDNVVHLCASSRFFDSLLQHQGLLCAQAVDVSMLDM